MIIKFLTGIALLLYSISLLSSCFEKLAGSKLKYTLSRYNLSLYKNTCIGTIMVLLLQSTTASITLIGGLASISIVSLIQSFIITVGINIGSAINMFLLAFQNFDILSYFSLFIVIGVALKMFFKSNSKRNIATILCGIGLLFVGLSLMSSSAKLFIQTDFFINNLSHFNNVWVLFFLGLVFSFLTNSPLGSAAILTSMISATQNTISFSTAVYFIYAINIGVCIIPFLTSLASKNIHFVRSCFTGILFNLIGLIVFVLLSIFNIIPSSVCFLNDIVMKIIFVNIYFNVFTAIITLPFSKKICSLTEKIFPETMFKNNEITISKNHTIGLIQLTNEAINLFYEVCDLTENAMLFSLSSAVSNIDECNNSLNECILSCNNNINNILELKSGLNKDDELQKRLLNTSFIGIEKTCRNIKNLINSCYYNQKKISFSDEQIKLLGKIQNIMLNNLLDTKNKVYELLFLNQKFENHIFYEIIERMNQISKLKVKAKKTVVSSNLDNTTNLNKYTCFLNVTNYFEQINTNLTDFVLNTLDINSAKNLDEK